MLRLLLLVACTSTALAQPFDRNDPDLYRPIDKDLSLAIGKGGTLFVVKGKQHARLGSADSFKSVGVDKAAKAVTVHVTDYTCVGESTHRFSFAHLDARIANAAAYAQHVKKDYKAAAAGFAQAAALDPTWNIPAYNLASAHQLLGDKPAAMAALAPWIASAPIATYLHVVLDPELAPLLDQPALVALRAKKPGAAKLSATKGIVGHALVNDAGLLAITRVEQSWGSSQFEIELQIWDPAKRTRVAGEMLVTMSDTDPGDTRLMPEAKKRIAAKLAAIETQLGLLGFHPAKVEVAVEGDHTDDKMKFHFKRAKLGIVGALGSNTVNMLRKSTSLGSAPVDGQLRGALLVDNRIVVARTQRHSAEGCDGGPEVGLVAFTLTP